MHAVIASRVHRDQVQYSLSVSFLFFTIALFSHTGTMQRTWKSTARRHLSVAEYTLPDWIADSLRTNFPEFTSPRPRISLGTLPTEIHPWMSLASGSQIFIKRDDKTGSSLSGNKVRKLEFIFADALSHRCDTVITCGGIQSNHCRAVAAIAAQMGLQCHLLLRSNLTDAGDLSLEGNLLLDHLYGAKCYLVGPKEPYKTHLLPRMQRLAEALREKQSRKAYIIPVGGSDFVGLFGYIAAFDEIVKDCPATVKNVFLACGSGGTLAGLAIANYLAGSKLRIYGISVCDNAEYFYDHVQQMLDKYLNSLRLRAQDICDVIDGYKGLGYGLSTPEEREFIRTVASDTGIILDPVYTGKAFRGMLSELEPGSDTYEGDSLFIHTGGIFGIFGEKSFSTTNSDSSESSLTSAELQREYGVAFWKQPEDPPPLA